MIITAHAFARAGLVGNPSDGISAKPFPSSSGIFAPPSVCGKARTLKSSHARDLARFDSVNSFLKDQRLHGYYGGMRLIKAAIKKFHEYCRHRGVELPDRSYTVSFSTDIPRLVGLAGSSAIVMAMLRALMQFHEMALPVEELPGLVLSVEREELGSAPVCRIGSFRRTRESRTWTLTGS